MSNDYGLAGKVAQTFLRSKLTPLLIFMSVLLGIAALERTPREEEPQIIVPMIDIFAPWPGHDAAEVERLLTAPLEDDLMDLSALDFLYSTSDQDGAMLIARFDVGYPVEKALILVRQTLAESAAKLPQGALPPQAVSRSIDDVPIFALTFFSTAEQQDPALYLSSVVEEVAEDFRKEPDVSDVNLIGSQSEEWFIALAPDKLSLYGLSPTALAAQLKPLFGDLPLTSVLQPSGQAARLEGLRLARSLGSLDELRAVRISSPSGKQLFLGDLAQISKRTQPLQRAVWFGSKEHSEPREAVTLAVSKRPGTNASSLTVRLQERFEVLRQKGLIPADVHTDITRDYGKSAKEKSDELIKHLMLATLSVIALIAIALGWRESIVVALAVPVTLALTLLLSYMLGFTINRVTLFALIFSIGILVDDAIVVVENIHRHAIMQDGRSWPRKILDAVNEVGNPTILATFTVIAAILPMAYVGGLMGPYMLPIPILASLAMLFSLLIAFVVSPWAAVRIMNPNAQHKESKEDWLNRSYRRFMGLMLRNRLAYLGFFAITGLLMLTAVSLVLFKAVEVKMLPFDNKNEVQVIIDMPEGTPLEDTARVAFEANQKLLEDPEVEATRIYVGTSSPYTFNGLVRHYFLRSASNEGDIAVTLREADKRSAKSHDIAKVLRKRLAGVGASLGANLKVVEIPPGPPVLATLVAEIYGPDLEKQRLFAQDIEEIMRKLEGVVDVDSYESAPRQQTVIHPDATAMARHGINAGQLGAELYTLANGNLGLAPGEQARTSTPVRLGMDTPLEQNPDAWAQLPIQGNVGQVPLGSIASFQQEARTKPIYHKNSQRVVYVTADVAGAIEAPVYALGELQKSIKARALELGIQDLPILHTSMPNSAEETMLKWDGEWHITVEVFRDMGIAFAAVVVLIYLLVVGWFRSFLVPLVILSPIPLSLVGILPGHWMFGAFFTATSMIGFIAGAGIIVRNSIILVDFIQIRQRSGDDLAKAVIDAGVIRFRPMLLTAAAVIVGAGVILFDPIFSGLAISLMMGEVAATLLSRFAVPLLYYGLAKRIDLIQEPANESATPLAPATSH